MNATRRILPELDPGHSTATSSKPASLKQRLRIFVLLGMLPAVSLLARPQNAPATPPLNFGNNFFVTGDYIVAGAYNMTSKFQTINGVSYAIGTISVPDSKNTGIQGVKQVPQGGQIVAALLYWQTVEKVGVTPGQTGSGQNGFFRPVFNGGPLAPGYAIAGTNITGANTVSWSSGGCSGTSTGKLLRTYRADVAGALPVDASGNPIANGTFEVRLPSVGNSTPITLGATLVIIYRLPGGLGVPLNAVVIYDGDYSQNNSQLIMAQSLQGFYDADQNTITKLTHIVGGGQSNKFQTVYFGKDANNLTKLPLPYGNKLPAFPGWYGMWDNPTWTFANGPSPLPNDAAGATTQVVPSASNQGCVSWGAVIMSTTVKNSDGDGILDSWKTDPRGPGYCDASQNNGSCTGPGDPAWVDLSGAATGHKDIFLQYDYMCSSISGGSCATGGTDYSFDPGLAIDPADQKNAVDKVVVAFHNHAGSPEPFALHAVPGNAILESQSSCADTDVDQSGNLTCPFPNEPGTLGFREGVAYIKNQTIEPSTGLLGCDPASDPNPCVAVFNHGKKDSYHYALFSHGVGLPSWFLSDKSLTSVTQSGSTVTFTTSTPHGLSPIAGDTVCSAAHGYIGRVSVVFAITNPNLEGTYCAKAVGNPPAANKFAITVKALLPGTVLPSYTVKTDPNLAVANGQVTSMSGFSDVGGQNSVISLGYGNWGPPSSPTSDGNSWQVKAGTFMHELGHTLGLTHGGTFYNNLVNNPSDYTPNYEPNCKPNLQSVMNYQFQVDLLEPPNTQNQVVDYSEETLQTLTENSPQLPGFLSNPFYDRTAWFELTSVAGGTPMGGHCDGTSLLGTDQPMSYVSDFVSNFGWSSTNGEDINFNGSSTDVLHGHDEWDGTPAAGAVGASPGLDLQQVSAVGTISTVGLGGEAGALKPAGGGGALKPAGGGGALKPAGGGGALKPAGGGGALKPAGGGGLKSDVTHEQVNSYARPPRSLTVTQEEVSPRYIDLSWTVPTFGQIVQYNIYRSAAGVNGGAFNQIGQVPGSQTTFQDTTATCNTGGYQYRVTAVINNDSPPPATLESTPSNVVSVVGQGTDPITACYAQSTINLTAPASGTQGDVVPITWSLSDDFYTTNGPVSNVKANTSLVAHGPLPNNCGSVGDTTILSNGVQTAISGASSLVPGAPGAFTFNFDTDAFCAGSYTFKLTLDSTQTASTPVASPLKLSIDINDQDNPTITTLSLPGATVGVAYPATTLTEDGGTAPFKWTVTGLPSGIAQQTQFSPTLSGTTCVAAATYPVTATVLDSANPQNSGSRGFNLQVSKATTTTGVASRANPSVFQQAVTFTVTVTPQSGCTPTGTVTLYDGVNAIGSSALTNGAATFVFSVASSLSVGVHNISASYAGDSSFTGSSSGVLQQIVNKASTSLSFSSIAPSTVFVGQPVTVSYAFGVVLPGLGSPVAPTGTVNIVASDGSQCVGLPTLGGGSCTLSPIPAAAGNLTFTINYSGDGNFIASGANGNYDVYQLVFTVQPSNTGVGAAIAPAVVVTAEDSNGKTLDGNAGRINFTGGITVAKGAGPGTLSGTLTQNAVAGVATFKDLGLDQVANGYTLTALPSPALGATSVTSSAFNVSTFYIDNQGNFGTLDLTTGNATQIGSGTLSGTAGIGVSLTPAPKLYTYNSSNQLLQIDPSAGTSTAIGSPGTVTLVATGSLTNGSYYGVDMAGNLYSIDLASGATTPLTPKLVAPGPVPAGCTLDVSLTGSASVLYYIVGYNGTGCSPDTLYQIDTINGTVDNGTPVTIGGAGAFGLTGSTFVGGKLYAFNGGYQEYTIDPSTGIATFVNPTRVNGTTPVVIIAAGASK
ncbi:MAG TPA: Ig-like domain repeat protein [Terriglobales bacterium]